MIPNWILALIKNWIKNYKTGSITINFFKGGVSNIKKEETVTKTD